MLAHLVVARSDISTAWTVEPFAIAAAVVGAALYAAGLYATGIRAVSRARAAAFALGVLVAVAATVSPLHAAAETTFAAHMLQHMLFMFTAAPLLVAGRPALVMALALPVRVRMFAWAAAATRPFATAVRLLKNPLTILIVYAGAVWTWHLPGPYQAAVTAEAAHATEHAMFLGVSIALWAGVTRTGPRRRIRHIPSMLLVLGTMLHSTWLAAILTFGGLAYPIYERRAPLWGIDPSADQQAAGAIMWIPSTLIFFTVFSVLFVRWFHELDTRHARRPTAVETP